MATHILADTVTRIVKRDSFFSRVKGLMFTLPLRDEAHVFVFEEAKQRTFHMSFVFYPIDIIFIYQDTVIDVKENFTPFSLYTSEGKADSVVEVPKGYIHEHSIKPTDTIVTQTH